MLWSHKIRQRNFKHHICWCAKFRLSYDIGIVDNRTNSDYHRASTHSWHYWEGPSWSSYGSWINNYLWNRYLSTLKLWVRIPLREGLLDTTWCDKVCEWLAVGRWFSMDTPVSSTNKSDSHGITEILLKVDLSPIFKFKFKVLFRFDIWYA